MITKTLPVALALGLAATASQAQQLMDHSGHAMPSAHEQAPSPQMEHGQMGHGDMDHGSMAHPPATGIPPGQEPRSPIPTLTEADRAAAFPALPPHRMHQGGSHFLFLADQLEWQDADDGSALAWDISGWLGGDVDRLAFRSEGERTDGHTEEAELQLLWSHAIGPWWETVAGVRQDFKPGSAQTWAAFGVQGMPVYGLETEATAFLGEGGQSALRLEADYDILLTRRWVLQPTAELNLHGRNDEARGVGAGLSEASVGLRLRYEITRQFAPYVGLSWNRAYGNTADILRANDEDISETRLLAGIRFWF
ncbi:copper resistance protein CopB [Stutzerimonas stutzeri]|uniref:Copper resistance protein CopB n=1 Tax=Stutzerimonas stutzeri TaxID=316 RepID=A0A2N8T716_STUST|nr:copper resistance protein B [Stutzerimonas stutzeri]MCQ4323549.1 copper resistance protein B [Stutzerimonas stutzeri]PNG10528.1 copper resistance protein CopB [Stutzerimonas stutzeri]